MSKRDIKSKVYKELKTGPKDLDELQASIGTYTSKKDIARVLDILVKDKWVERVARKYQLKYSMGRPGSPSNRCKGKYWNYEKIQEAQGGMDASTEDEWFNHHAECVPHEDDASSTSHLSKLKYFELADPIQDTPDDQFDVTTHTGGYASIATWSGVKDAIRNYGVVILELNLYENYESRFKDELLPDPDGDPIGSIMVCAVGYDKETIWFLNVWKKGWPKYSGISRQYFEVGCGSACVLIDTEDYEVAKSMYGTVIVSSNVPCEIWIGKTLYTGKVAKASVELGKEVCVYAIPMVTTVEGDMYHLITPTKEDPNVSVSFVFDEEVPWITRLRKRIQLFL